MAYHPLWLSFLLKNCLYPDFNGILQIALYYGISSPFSHTFLACLSIIKGLSKISVNKAKIKSDLNDHWIILAEGIQTILRREGVEGSYEILKALTRGKASVSRSELHEFIHSLKVKESVKKELLHLTPFSYIGLARQR